MSRSAVLKQYYDLTKPGIVRGNLLTAAAGGLLAIQGDAGRPLGSSLQTMTIMLSGLALVVAAACVTNNYLDRGLDARMQRTRQRALVRGSIGNRSALSFAAVMLAAGTAGLLLGTTVLAAALAFTGYLAYVVLYGWAKRRSVHGTLIGSLSGAIPPLVGYTALGGRLDLTAGLLFIILVTWQMPHFYAIAIYRLQDYRAASLPVLPAVKGVAATRRQLLAYIVLFTLAAPLLTAIGRTGITYAVLMVGLGVFWLARGLRGLRGGTQDARTAGRWAGGMFGLSLVIISAWCLAIALNPWLP